MRKFNPELETKKIVTFIQEYQLKQKTEGAVIGEMREDSDVKFEAFEMFKQLDKLGSTRTS